VEIVVVAPSTGLPNIGGGVATSSEVHGPKSALEETALELEVSVDNFPVLRSHVLNGKAVVPAALMVEWIAHGAMHGHPGMTFQGMEDFAILKGIILAGEESVSLSVEVQSPTQTQHGLLIPVQIVSRQGDHFGECGVRSAECGVVGGGHRVHARARVLLGNDVLVPPSPTIATPSIQDGRTKAEIYTPEFLFHGSALEGIEALTGIEAGGIAATVSPTPKPSAWISEPLRQTWITEPLMLDCCFQLMILWSLKHQGAHSLPTGLAQYRQFVRRFPKHPITVRIQITSIEQQVVHARMECLDGKGSVLALLEGYQCVLEPSLKAAFTRNRLARLQQA
jgi:hypothetical protein